MENRPCIFPLVAEKEPAREYNPYLHLGGNWCSAKHGNMCTGDYYCECIKTAHMIRHELPNITFCNDCEKRFSCWSNESI